MPSHQLTNHDELKQWVLRRLGAPVVRVELTDDQLQDAINASISWFASKKGVVKQYMLSTAPGETQYTLPTDADVVTDVVFEASNMDLSTLVAPYMLPEQQELPASLFTSGASSGGLYSHYTQMLQYIEMGRRVLGKEPDWRQEGKVLYLFPARSTASQVLVFYTSHQFDMPSMNERDYDLFTRYVLAKAKEQLGRNRSKFDGYPTAQGQAQLDGQNLLSEAATDIEALNQEIADAGGPMGFMAG